MSQKLSSWASIAEIVSAFAVVLTLVFLIVEIRGNTVAIEWSNRQSLAERYEEINLGRATSEPLAIALNKILTNQEYEAHEGLMARGYLTAMVKNLEEGFLQYQDGNLSEAYLMARAGGVVGYFGNDNAMVALGNWKSRGANTEEFLVWFEQVIEDHWGPLEAIGTSDDGGSTQ